jgi:hypothetical protein
MNETIIELIKTYSNDAELGRKLREYYWKLLEEQRIESWYKR